MKNPEWELKQHFLRKPFVTCFGTKPPLTGRLWPPLQFLHGPKRGHCPGRGSCSEGHPDGADAVLQPHLPDSRPRAQIPALHVALTLLGPEGTTTHAHLGKNS